VSMDAKMGSSYLANSNEGIKSHVSCMSYRTPTWFFWSLSRNDSLDLVDL
jgi:hypothetical protein